MEKDNSFLIVFSVICFSIFTAGIFSRAVDEFSILFGLDAHQKVMQLKNLEWKNGELFLTKEEDGFYYTVWRSYDTGLKVEIDKWNESPFILINDSDELVIYKKYYDLDYLYDGDFFELEIYPDPHSENIYEEGYGSVIYRYGEEKLLIDRLNSWPTEYLAGLEEGAECGVCFREMSRNWRDLHYSELERLGYRAEWDAEADRYVYD